MSCSTARGEYAGQKLCPIHKKPVEILSEENYFFKLSEYSEKLLAHYEANPGFIQPESARNEVVNFVRQGLQDLSISRSTFDWGVPVPWDDKHVIYVWIDALLNYATAVGYNENPEKFESTFPADVHLVGQGHPPLPRDHLAGDADGPGPPAAREDRRERLVDGRRREDEQVQPDRHQAAGPHLALRRGRVPLVLPARDRVRPGRLVLLGGLLRPLHQRAGQRLRQPRLRVAAIVGKYFGGELPASEADGDAEKAIHDGLAKAVTEADRKIGEELDFQGGILAVFDFVKQVNGYITEQEPWKVAKDTSDEGKARLATILYTAAESLRAVAVLLNPIMPDTSQKLWDSLGAEASLGGLAGQRSRRRATGGRLPAGSTVTKGAVLFPRLEEKPTA